MQKIMFGENYYLQPYNFYMIVIYKQLLEKFHFEFLHVFNFSCTWNIYIYMYVYIMDIQILTDKLLFRVTIN